MLGDSLVFQLAKQRKTVRKFSSQQVDLARVLEAIETACQAPSGANSQPWRFLIISDIQIKRRIRDACERGEKEFYSKIKGDLKEWLLNRGLSWKKPFLETAPILIIIFSDRRAPYSVQSVWLAIGYMMLALEEMGLGTVTYTPSIQEHLEKAVNAPVHLELETILPIGISVDKKVKEPRKCYHEVTFINSWTQAQT